MSNVHRYFIGAAIGGLLLAGGYLVYKLVTDASQSVEMDSLSKLDNPKSVSESNSLQELNSAFLKFSNYSSDFSRRAGLYSLLERASKQQVIELLRQSEKISHHSIRASTQEMIFQRLASLDPQLAVRELLEYPKSRRGKLVLGIFREWSLLDVDSAIEEARNLDRLTRIEALKTILKYRDDLPTKRHIEIAKRIENASFAHRFISISNAELLIDTPEEAWQVITTDNVSDSLQLDTLGKIASEWVDQMGFDILRRLFNGSSVVEHPDHASSIMAGIVESNPQGFLDFVTSMSSEEQRPFLKPLFETWIRLDPEATIQALESFRNSVYYDALEAHVIKSWARYDPSEVIEEIQAFSEDTQVRALEEAVAAIARHSPQDAVRHLEYISTKVGNASSIATRLVAVWSEQEPREALNWILSPDGSQYLETTSLMNVILPKLARVDAEMAMQMALDQTKSPNGIEVDVIQELTRINIEQAVEFLPQVRDNNALSAHLAVGFTLVRQGDPLRGMNLASKLPDHERDSYRYAIAQTWARTHPIQMHNALEDLPSKEIKSLAAKGLALSNWSNPVLSDDQLEYVKSFLNERDSQEVEDRLAQ